MSTAQKVDTEIRRALVYSKQLDSLRLQVSSLVVFASGEIGLIYLDCFPGTAEWMVQRFVRHDDLTYLTAYHCF